MFIHRFRSQPFRSVAQWMQYLANRTGHTFTMTLPRKNSPEHREWHNVIVNVQCLRVLTVTRKASMYFSCGSGRTS